MCYSHGCVSFVRIMLHIISLLVVFAVSIRASVVVQIDQGALKGRILESDGNGRKFYGFYRIPYAQPPVNELRFQPPNLPPPSWHGVRDATQKPLPFCPQLNNLYGKGYYGSEDCLYLEVFTHIINSTSNAELRPVLVFFHGSSFEQSGGAVSDPSLIMNKPIVVVIANFRLGVLGFFSTGDSVCPGNQALKDQTAVLQWVQKNIYKFGGDANAVTIMGGSTGAGMVHLHMMSPLSKGLFHRAILHSGSANNLWAFSTTKRARRVYQSFMQHTNCSRPSTNESVACLLALSAETLTRFVKTFPAIDSRAFTFNPVLEPPGSEGAFLSTDPNEFGYTNLQMPSIFGFTSNEYNTQIPRRNFSVTDENIFDHELAEDFSYEAHDNVGLTQNITALVKRLYLGNNFPDSVNYNTMTILLGDMRFKLSVLDSIRTYPGPTYAFEYDFRNSPEEREFGVGHGAELEALIPQGSKSKLDVAQKYVSDIMLTYWSNFIRTGDPNIPEKNLPDKWVPAKDTLDSHSMYLMYISNTEIKMNSRKLFDEKDELWKYYITNRHQFTE